MPPVAVKVEGLAEFQRSLREAAPLVAAELRRELLAAAAPVATTAHTLALQRIPKVTSPWSEFRIGATSQLVYLAPKQRGSRSPLRRRRNFADLLMTRAMEPALAGNETVIAQRAELAVGRALEMAGL